MFSHHEVFVVDNENDQTDSQTDSQTTHPASKNSTGKPRGASRSIKNSTSLLELVERLKWKAHDALLTITISHNLSSRTLKPNDKSQMSHSGQWSRPSSAAVIMVLVKWGMLLLCLYLGVGSLEMLLGVWRGSMLGSELAIHGRPGPSNISEISPLPPIMWTYFEGQAMDHRPSGFLSLVIEQNWKRFNPGYEVIVVCPDNLRDTVSVPVPWTFYTEGMTSQQRLEWVKLAVLVEYGGVWVDPWLLFLDGIGMENLFAQEDDEEDIEAATFFLPPMLNELSRSEPARSVPRPVIQPFILAALPFSTFILSWFNEFNLAVSSYKKDKNYIEHLQKSLGSKFPKFLGAVLGNIDLGSPQFNLTTFQVDSKIHQGKHQNLTSAAEDYALRHVAVSWRDSTFLTAPLAAHKVLALDSSLPLPYGFGAKSEDGPMRGYITTLEKIIASGKGDPDEAFADILMHGSVDEALGTDRGRFWPRSRGNRRAKMVWVGEQAMEILMMKIEGGESASRNSLLGQLLFEAS
ncbi:hypothetical protein HDU97_004032 [Phlyctochytrium planicorne]|nr:hypothetical protein HDU97_004032 [Phlyctochytrium planicorne]